MGVCRTTAAAALAAALGLAAPAVGQPASKAPAAEPHKEGEYSGVQPGEAKPDASGKARDGKAAQGTLTWVGFQAQDDGAELFFQSPGQFSVAQRIEGGALVVSLDGIKRMARNTRRPLDTRFFDTPVARVEPRMVRARGKKRGARAGGVEVRILFKKGTPPREAAVRTEKGPDGMFYAYVDVAGSAKSATE